VVNPIGIVAAPTFTPAVGTYTSAQSVTIADSTTGASIYYTTDGSTPGAGTGTSSLYNGTPISVATSETINAIGVLIGYTNSAVAPAAYVINLPAPTITNPTLSATSLTGLQMLLLLTIGVSLFTGCGGPGSAASTSTVTVTARAAGVSSTTSTFTLTVQ
jgi:hypothetical protein